MKKICITLACLLVALCMTAQDDFVSHMNKIKDSREYYFSHYRGDSEEEGYKKCVKEILTQVCQNHKGTFDEAFVRQNSQKRIKSGNPCRVFVYMKKAIAANVKSGGTKIVLKRDLPMEGTIQDSVTEQAIEPTPVLNPEPVYQQFPQPESVTNVVPATGKGDTLLSRIVNDIMARKGIKAAYGSFHAKKDLGLATGYGPLKSAGNMEKVYVVIYDHDSSTPRAILTPTEGGVRKNLMTGREDSFTNYHNVEAFWFTIK